MGYKCAYIHWLGEGKFTSKYHHYLLLSVLFPFILKWFFKSYSQKPLYHFQLSFGSNTTIADRKPRSIISDIPQKENQQTSFSTQNFNMVDPLSQSVPSQGFYKTNPLEPESEISSMNPQLISAKKQLNSSTCKASVTASVAPMIFLADDYIYGRRTADEGMI